MQFNGASLMSTSNMALLFYCAWSICLLSAIAVLRGTLTLRGTRSANSFSVSGDDVSPFSARLCRAHANCYENLPAFAGIILVAALSGHTELTDPLALWVCAARVGQSTIHIISTSNSAVAIRFGFLFLQVLIQVFWIAKLVQLA